MATTPPQDAENRTAQRHNEEAEIWRDHYTNVVNALTEFCDELGMNTEPYDSDDFDPEQMMQEFAAKYARAVRPVVAAVDKTQVEAEERE